MSVTITGTDKLTMFTVTSDPDSRWPPLCQILKSLCYSPAFCSASQQLRNVQGTSLSVLGAIQIMIGLLNIGLGINLFLVFESPWYPIRDTWFPFWLGALFIVFGIVVILSEKYPSPCLVIISVILNLAGVAFAITAIALYSNYVTNIHWAYYGFDKRDSEILLRSVSGVLIVLSAVELCVAFSSAVLGIKALRSTNKNKNKSYEDPQQYNPLLEDVIKAPE